jgi:DNA replication protein DnaC
VNFLKLNINEENYNLSDWMIIFEKFGQRPNKTVVHDFFSKELFLEIIQSKNEPNLLTEYIPSEDSYIINQKVLLEIEENIWISYVIVDKDSETSMIDEVTFFYKEKEQEIKVIEFVDKLCQCVIELDINSKTQKFNTISLNATSIELEPLHLSIDDIELDCRYNTDIIKKSDKLIKKIKKKERGISVLCGDKGLGKTTLSKYIASNIDRICIFIPNNMIDLSINNPEFKNFLRKFENPLIIIDDCEFLTNNQFTKLNYFSNNIQQLVDGFLSESLNLQVILIFNENLDEIEEDILDSNSLIDCIEFDLLETDTANELSKILGNNKKYKSPVRLIEVIQNKKSEKIEKIGL